MVPGESAVADNTEYSAVTGGDESAAGGENVVRALATAPASWWRPSLGVTLLLDTLASDALPPVGLIVTKPDQLVPALLRMPAAACFSVQPWSLAEQALLPTVGQFVGFPPVVAPLAVAPRAAFQTLLWFDPGLLPRSTDIRRVRACLARHGRLAGIFSNAPFPAGSLAVMRLRHRLRRAGMHVEPTTGYLGPRALAWSAAARLALAAGRQDHYDRCHAAMRSIYAEGWPLALLCRGVVVIAAMSVSTGR